MKKFCTLLLFAVFFFACKINDDGNNSVYNEDSVRLKEQLEKLEYVKKVKIVERDESSGTTADSKLEYLIYFEQPLDWNNPDGQKFLQRVFLVYRGKNNINSYYCGGYILSGGISSLTKAYDGNSIEIEYRLFKDSKPEDISFSETKYWDYLTSENASKDFNRIISSLKKFLPGKSVFSGTSKGGYTTNALAYYFPNVVDAFVAFCAPLCDGLTDSRFLDFCYSTVGNSDYGTELAAKRRQILLDYQVELILNKDVYFPKFQKYLTTAEITVNNPEYYYIVCVSDLVAGVWMTMKESQENFFDNLSTALAEKNSDKLWEIFSNLSPYDFSLTKEKSPYYPYVIQARMEMGNYRLGDTTYINEELEKRGLSEKKLPEYSLIKEYVDSQYYTSAQREAFNYNPGFRNKLAEWAKTVTEKNVFFVNGAVDPWIAVGIDTDSSHSTHSSNIHCFTIPRAGHTSDINLMPENQKNQFISELNEFLK